MGNEPALRWVIQALAIAGCIWDIGQPSVAVLEGFVGVG